MRASLLLLLFPALACEAQFPSSPPLFTDDAETVEKGHFEINLSAGISGDADAWESETPLVDANYGLSENVHVNAEIPFVFGEDVAGNRAGFGRTAVAVKYRFLAREAVEMAVHPALELPPLPDVSLDAHGKASLTLPVVLDLALGNSGMGMGLELARTLDLEGHGEGWAAAIGYACPLDSARTFMADYASQADEDFESIQNAFEIGYVQEKIFGVDCLNLLSEAGLSTDLDLSLFLGAQLAL